MAKRYILILDAGTSGPRCLILDNNCKPVGYSKNKWVHTKERNAPPFARAFDITSTKKSIGTLIKKSIQSAGISNREIAAVSVTSQRQGIVFLDKSGIELYGGPNLDLRAVFEGASIDEQMGNRIYQTTGHLPSFLFSMAKLRWFQIHQPESYDRIAHVLPLGDWLAWKLTNTLASEITLAAEAGLVDIHHRKFCSGLLNDLELINNPIPLVRAGTIVGYVTPNGDIDTGLLPGTPVAVAGADTQCGLLGMGILDNHQVGIVAGWTTPLQMVTEKPVLPLNAKTWTGLFWNTAKQTLEHDRENGGKWVLESSAGDLGNSYQWIADNLWGDGINVFQKMNALSSAVPIGSDGAYAFLGPSRMDMSCLGMTPGGFVFPTPLTFSELRTGHLVRATLEAMAYTIRANLEQIEELVGVQSNAIALGGGMTSTETFVNIVTNVIGKNIKISNAPWTSAIGAYLCACTALGDFASLEEASISIKPKIRDLDPDPNHSADYEELYHQWLQNSRDFQELSLQ